MGPRKDRQPDGIDILLDGGRDDLVGRLAKTGVNNLETGVSKGGGDYFNSAIVTIKSGLGKQDSVFSFHVNPLLFAFKTKRLL